MKDQILYDQNLKDPKVFEGLYNAYWKKVYTICQAGTQDTDEAKELTQKIFVSLWQKRNELILEGPIEHYLLRAAKYQVMNYYRDQKIKTNHQDCFYMEQCGKESCTENEVLYQQLDSRIAELVDKLPCQCKTVFQLRQEQGLSLKEIADKLAISVKTVQYHLDNAKKYLKKELSEYF